MAIRSWILNLFGRNTSSAISAHSRGKNRIGSRARLGLEALEDRALLSAVTFAPAVNYAAGGISVAVGDFNGDGKPDLATANYYSNDASVLLGNGDGTFQSAVLYGVGSVPSAVTAGDFNGDGKQDLAVTNSGTNNVSVLLGNGDGIFQNAVNYGAGPSPDSVAVGDFNGDGKQDLVTANPNYDRLSVLLGNGDGSFQGAVAYFPGDGPQSVAVGDFNGDGKQDLATANQYSNNVGVLLGNGDGTFQNAVKYTAGISTYAVAVGDFNSDGKPDLVTANHYSNNASVLLGNGDGTFQSAVNYDAGIGPMAVAVADFNGDGKQDLAVANGGDIIASNASASVLLGNGNGAFQSAVKYSAGILLSSVAVGDFNGDGKSDVVVANLGVSTVSVLLNTTAPGSLQFSAPVYHVAENGGSATITVTRTGGNDGTVTVRVATTSGSATVGTDFIDASQTLTFADGETSKTITVPIVLDSLVEGNETVNLTLSSPTGGAILGAQSMAVLTIQRPAITVALVERPVGTTKKLFVKVFYADSGKLKTRFLSPLQSPTFYKIRATAYDSNGDGLADAVMITARRVDNHRLVRRIRLV